MAFTFQNILDRVFPSSRGEELKQFAYQEGYSYSRQGLFAEVPHYFARFRLLKKGSMRAAHHFISGELPSVYSKLSIYDFHTNKKKEKTTVIEIKCNQTFDEFYIRPKSALFGIKNLFLSREPFFPELTAFNEKYILEYDAFNKSNIPLNSAALRLLSTTKDTYIESKGNQIIFYSNKYRLSPEELEEGVTFAENFVSKLLFDNTDNFV